jgi:cytochrome c556
MADNTTEYKVIVDTEVTGGEQVGQLGDEADKTGGKFKSLKSQIRETTVQLQKLADEGKEGSAEFEKLRSKLDELNDAQDRVNFQAGQFDDQLAALPGPIGQVGGALKGFQEGLNKFSLGFKLALGAVVLIIGAITAFKESLSRTEEGQKKLNKITEAFEKIMNGVFAVIEPVAMMFADLVIQLLSSEKVMKVLSVTMGVLAGTFTAVLGVGKELVGFIINNFVNAFKTLVGVAGGAGKVLKGVFTFDLDLIKEGVAQVGTTVSKGFTSFVDNAKNTAKGIGTAVVNGVQTGFEAGSKSFSEGSKRLTEAEKKAAEEAAAKRKERGEKAAEEAKKLEEQRLKDLEAANKVLTESYLAGLEDRDKEIYKRGQKLNEDIAALEKAGITDRTAVLEAYNKDVTAINTKFDEEAAKKAEEKKKEEYDTFKKGLDEKLLENDNYYKQLLQNESDNLDKKISLINEREQLLLSDTALTEAQRTQITIDAEQARRDARTQSLDESIMLLDQESEALGTSFDRKREIIAQKEAELLAQTGLSEAQRTQIVKAAAEERKAIDMAELEAKAELQTAYLDLASGFGSFLKEIAGKNKKLAIAGVVVEQAAAIGKIIVNTGIANAKALAASPLTFGQPWIAINTISAGLSIASSIAAGVKAIQQIKNSDSGAAPSGGTPPKTAGGAAPSAPGIGGGGTAVPQITGTDRQASPGSQIAQTIGAASNKPIRAYVVSGDITGQQALDRRTNRAATFSGGAGG